MEFEVQRCTRRCAASDRELKPGESFYSVLLPDVGEVKRMDYALDVWSGPPEGSIGHWRSRMPDPNNQKVDWAPNDVILHYFIQLEGRPDSADVRFVLTLWMIRRRILRLEDNEKSDEGAETMILFCPKNETEYRVPVKDPSPERILAIQEELASLLFSGEPSSPDDPPQSTPPDDE